jgi:hypothetical protein
MYQLGIDLRNHEVEILRLFREVIARPPMRLAEDHDLGNLPRILHDLIEVSFLHPNEVRAHEAKVAAAIAHGETRRALGMTEQIIFEEFSAVREALRRYLDSSAIDTARRREALMRLDMATSVAELAAIRGFHREAFEKAGLWETLVSDLARNSPLVGLPAPVIPPPA